MQWMPKSFCATGASDGRYGLQGGETRQGVAETTPYPASLPRFSVSLIHFLIFVSHLQDFLLRTIQLFAFRA